LEFIFILFFFEKIILFIIFWGLGIGDWGLGIGDWGLGIGPNPQSPIHKMKIIFLKFEKKLKIILN
jgi:hypothetical protein